MHKNLLSLLQGKEKIKIKGRAGKTNVGVKSWKGYRTHCLMRTSCTWLVILQEKSLHTHSSQKHRMIDEHSQSSSTKSNKLSEIYLIPVKR